MKTKLRHLLTLGITLASLSSLHGQSFLTNGLVAYYPFNGNANDESGNGRGLTNRGAVLVKDRFGNDSAAFSFNGFSSILVQTNAVDSLVLTQAATYSCWIKPTVIQAGAGSLVRKDGHFTTYLLYDASTVEQFVGGKEYRIDGARIPSAVWSMLTSTWDGTNVTQYVNGQPQGVLQSISLKNGGPKSVVNIGGSLIYNQYFNGLIDDIRIYNRWMSPNQVAALYVSESQTKGQIGRSVNYSAENLYIGSSYQFQVSSDLVNWTNWGPAFTATNTFWRAPYHWDVPSWDALQFRLLKQ